MTHELRENVVYRDSEPQFAIERQDNCVALIPMRIYTRLLDNEFRQPLRSDAFKVK